MQIQKYVPVLLVGLVIVVLYAIGMTLQANESSRWLSLCRQDSQTANQNKLSLENQIKVKNKEFELLNGQMGDLNQSFRDYQSSKEIEVETLQSQNKNLEEVLTETRQELNDANTKLGYTTNQLRSTASDLSSTQKDLATTNQKYDLAAPFQERVSEGMYLQESYKLLSEYTGDTKNQVAEIVSISPTFNDNEIWARAKNIYDWMGNNFAYCYDKGISVDGQMYKFQFWSPDELMVQSTGRDKCGDCDDHAFLFAGMMYASGIPQDKVSVICGQADGQGHCWNEVNVEGTGYIIDPVCSNTHELINFLGLSFGLNNAQISESKYADAKCFKSYLPQYKLNPEGFSNI